MKRNYGSINKIRCLILLALFTLTSLTSVVFAYQSATNYTTAKRFNSGGQLTGTISPDPDGTGDMVGYPAIRNTYDSQGRLEKIEHGYLSSWQSDNIAPDNWSSFSISSSTDFTFNNYGLISTQTVNDTIGESKNLTQYSYDEKNRVECKTVRMNPATFNSLPSSACSLGPEGVYGPDRITRYEYDELDQVLVEWRAWGTDLEQKYAEYTYISKRLIESLTDANGNKTELRYDGYKRLHKRVYPSKDLSGTLNENDYNEYLYDDNGNLQWERKRNGGEISYEYDNNNRMVKKDISGTANDVFYAYDLRGLNLYSRFSSASGQGITNVFDGLGNLESTTSTMNGSSRRLSYSYDNNGNRTKVTHPNNFYATYFFDQLNRVYRIQSHGSTSVWVNYDSYGRRNSIERTLHRTGAKTDYEVDDLGRLESIGHAFLDSASNMTNSFTYTPSSQIEAVTYSNDQYYYFGNENRTGDYQVNGLNQYTSVNGNDLSYDDNGNLTNDNLRTYTYDVENRLVNITGDITAGFVYDPLGRLFQITINGVVRQFLYDGDSLVSEYLSSGSITPVNCYIHGDQVDEPLLQFNGICTSSSAARRLLHADHQGSIIAHSSYSGSVLSTNTYDTYGTPGLENEGRFGYTGQIWLPELDLYYYKARMYSPTLGRFLQTDPIGYEDQMNLYAYVHNDPMNMVDPTGMCSEAFSKSEMACGAADALAGVIEKGLNAMGMESGPAPEYEFEYQGSGDESLGGQVTAAAVATGVIAAKANTEPTLPDKKIAEGDSVEVVHNYKSNDHGPAHAHVNGGGKTTRIGMNGKPLKGDPELTKKQAAVVKSNKSSIRKAVKKIGKWLQHHE